MQCPVEALTLLLRATLDDKVQVLMLCPLYPTMTVTIRLDALLYILRSCCETVTYVLLSSLPHLSLRRFIWIVPQIQRVKQALGNAYRWSNIANHHSATLTTSVHRPLLGNPNGYYRLDLADPMDRCVISTIRISDKQKNGVAQSLALGILNVLSVEHTVAVWNMLRSPRSCLSHS